MRKIHGNRVRNGKVITVFRQVYSASFILIKSPQDAALCNNFIT